MLQPSTPTFDYLPWQIMHSLLLYIQSLTTASGSRLFGSVARALDFYLGRPGSNPTIGGKFFSYASFLCYDFHVVRGGACPGTDFTSPKMVSSHRK